MAGAIFLLACAVAFMGMALENGLIAIARAIAKLKG